MTLSPRKRREAVGEIRELLVKAGRLDLASMMGVSLLTFIKPWKSFAPKKKRKGAQPAQARREAKRRRHAENATAIRAAVMLRAGGRCEMSDGIRCSMDGTDLDHMLQGSGRRRQRQSAETCWLLCAWHHRERTRNRPSSRAWRGHMRRHLDRYGYPTPRELSMEVEEAKQAARKAEVRE